MADLTTARTAHEADLAHAERREVVMQHEALGSLTGLQQFDALLVVLGSERHRHQRLRLASRENSGAMSAREHTRLDSDGPDLIKRAAIGPAAVEQHLVAENALLQHVVKLGGLLALLFRQRLDHLFLDGRDLGIALELGILFGVERVGEILARLIFNLGEKVLVDGRRSERSLRLPGYLYHLLDHVRDFAAALVA